jgi:Zn-dependent protease with chaperone function
LAVDKAQWQTWKKDRSFSGFLIDLNGGDPQSEARAAKAFSGLGHPGLLDEIRLLAKNAGLPETPLVVIDTGREGGGAEAIKLYGQNTLVIHKGLLKQENAEELKGTIGHELAHMTAKEGWLFRAYLKAYLKVAGQLAAIKKPVLLKLLKPALLPLRWKQRRDETQADKRGAVIAGGVEGMISNYSGYLSPKQATPLSFSGITDRIKSSVMERLFSAHLTDKKRIKDLKRFAVRHAGEIQASKSRLDDLRGKMGGDFEAASRPVAAKPSASALGVSRSTPGLR